MLSKKNNPATVSAAGLLVVLNLLFKLADDG